MTSASMLGMQSNNNKHSHAQESVPHSPKADHTLNRQKPFNTNIFITVKLRTCLGRSQFSKPKKHVEFCEGNSALNFFNN